MSRKSAEFYIEKLKLLPHPEGGFYAETFRSTDTVVPTDSQRYEDNQSATQEKITRAATTSIYFLLNEENYSAWHILKSDEIWNYHAGSALYVHTIDKSTGELKTHVLGNPCETDAASFQVVIKAGTWFAAELIDKKSFILLGCSVSPGFVFQDFKLADKKELTTQFPQHGTIIERLCTREKSEQQNVVTTTGTFRLNSLLSKNDSASAVNTPTNSF